VKLELELNSRVGGRVNGALQTKSIPSSGGEPSKGSVGINSTRGSEPFLAASSI
jgi:hypothetical protein